MIFRIISLKFSSNLVEKVPKQVRKVHQETPEEIKEFFYFHLAPKSFSYPKKLQFMQSYYCKNLCFLICIQLMISRQNN